MFISITFTETSIDETITAESQRLKIYIENVHHSREHMHSNDYTMHCAIAAAMMVETDRK